MTEQRTENQSLLIIDVSGAIPTKIFLFFFFHIKRTFHLWRFFVVLFLFLVFLFIPIFRWNPKYLSNKPSLLFHVFFIHSFNLLDALTWLYYIGVYFRQNNWVQNSRKTRINELLFGRMYALALFTSLYNLRLRFNKFL